MTNSLVIRADASPAIGAGHVMRSLALAQAWQDEHPGAEVVFAVAACPDALVRRLEREGCRVERVEVAPGTDEDATRLREVAARSEAAWVVVDGYAFDDAYEGRVAGEGLSLLAWDDDGHAWHTAAQIVLNQNLHASCDAYEEARSRGATLLLGGRYICLRREVRAFGVARGGFRESVERVLVMGGGADAHGATSLFLDAVDLAKVVDPAAVDVIIGGASDAGDLIAGRARARGHQVVVDAANPAEQMQRADLAIAAAGSTLWELAFMGVPSLVTPVAANQEPLADAASRLGIARSLGRLGEVTPTALAEGLRELAGASQERASMHTAAMVTVDGHGASRVVAVMRGERVFLRAASLADAELLLAWANEPTTRAASFSSASIGWDEHQAWLSRKLRDPACALWIATDGAGGPIGQVRIDMAPLGAADGVAEISVSVDAAHRGGGRGREIIALGVTEAFRSTPVGRVRALIKPENAASIRAFEAVGFVRVADVVRAGRPVRAYEIVRPGGRS